MSEVSHNNLSLVNKHTYYRCTKKSKITKCNQPYTREEEVDRQLSDNIMTVSLRQDWADKMLHKLSLEEKDVAQSCHAFVGSKQSEIKAINEKLQRLARTNETMGSGSCERY